MTHQGRWTTGWVALAAAIAFGSTVRADEVRIWPTATVTRDVITVGDIAELTGLVVERDRLREVVVHAAPQPGAEIRICVAHVREAFADSKADLAEINFIGASACRVSRARLPEAPKPVIVREKRPPQQKRGIRKSNQQVKAANSKSSAGDAEESAHAGGETLETALRGYIEAHAPAHEGKLDIRFGAANRDALALLSGECSFDIHPDIPDSTAASENWLGAKTYRVDVTRADQKTTPVAIIAELALIRPVVVAKQPINLGQKLDQSALRVEQRRFDDVQKMGVSDLRAAVGLTAAQFIPAEAMVMAKSLAPAPVVKRGEAVTIWRRGGVQIRLTGKAQGDGMLGSTIKVRRNGSKNNRELLDAVVTGPGTVELCDEVRVATK